MRINAVIGLLAKPGGGKGTFKRLFLDACNKDGYFPSINTYRFSDPLRKTLQWYDILESRENMQALSTCLRTCKPASLATALGKMIEDDKFSDMKIADGVRSLDDERMIKRSSNGLMVYVQTSPEKRLERIRLRKENTGDETKTAEQFAAEDNAEPERYIEDIGSRAEFVIDNNGTLEDYRRQVAEFYDRLIRPLRFKQDE